MKYYSDLEVTSRMWHHYNSRESRMIYYEVLVNTHFLILGLVCLIQNITYDICYRYVFARVQRKHVLRVMLQRHYLLIRYIRWGNNCVTNCTDLPLYYFFYKLYKVCVYQIRVHIINTVIKLDQNKIFQ